MRWARLLGALAVPGFVAAAAAGDAELGRRLSEPCAACHGADGISVSGDIPNLAGQKEAYLGAQLKAYRSGSRENAFMQPIAAELSDDDIANLAAYWASLRGKTGADVSDLVAEFNQTRVHFPADYKSTFTWYASMNLPERNQMRRYYANDTALEAARQGRALPPGSYILVEVYTPKRDQDGNFVVGADGFFEPETLDVLSTMEAGAGWGANIPDLFRNGEWNYALFDTDGTRKADTNHALCFACHKAKEAESHIFTMAELIEAARK